MILWNRNIYYKIKDITDLLTSFHDDSYSRDEIGSLLPDLSRLVVHSPQNDTANLRQVGFYTFAQLVYYSSEAV